MGVVSFAVPNAADAMFALLPLASWLMFALHIGARSVAVGKKFIHPLALELHLGIIRQEFASSACSCLEKHIRTLLCILYVAVGRKRIRSGTGTPAHQVLQPASQPVAVANLLRVADGSCNY